MPYIAELEKKIWIAPWDGDPGRTLDFATAKRFPTRDAANRAIKRAQQYRPFINAHAHYVDK